MENSTPSDKAAAILKEHGYILRWGMEKVESVRIMGGILERIRDGGEYNWPGPDLRDTCTREMDWLRRFQISILPRGRDPSAVETICVELAFHAGMLVTRGLNLLDTMRGESTPSFEEYIEIRRKAYRLWSECREYIPSTLQMFSEPDIPDEYARTEGLTDTVGRCLVALRHIIGARFDDSRVCPATDLSDCQSPDPESLRFEFHFSPGRLSRFWVKTFHRRVIDLVERYRAL